MKAFSLWLMALAVSTQAGNAAPIQEAVPVKLGPKSFRDGDVIQILEVESTSPALEQGDVVTVQGQYRLESQPSASLQLLLTQLEGDGAEETDETQIVKAVEGWHPFEAMIVIKHRGLLHLSFYDEETGTPFGGVYFGTEKQMAAAEPSLTAHHRVEETAESENFERSGQKETIARLRYDYSFGPEVTGFLKSGEASQALEERSSESVERKPPEVLWEKLPTGDLNQEWPPREFRIENDKKRKSDLPVETPGGGHERFLKDLRKREMRLEEKNHEK